MEQKKKKKVYLELSQHIAFWGFNLKSQILKPLRHSKFKKYKTIHKNFKCYITALFILQRAKKTHLNQVYIKPKLGHNDEY